MLQGWTTCNLSLAPGLYEDWRSYINRTILIPTYRAHTGYIPVWFSTRWIFHTLKQALKAFSLGRHLLRTHISIHYTPGDLLSDLLSVRPIALNKKLLSCHASRPDYLQSELSSGSVLELKGLYQWNFPYSELLSSYWLHYIFKTRCQTMNSDGTKKVAKI